MPDPLVLILDSESAFYASELAARVPGARYVGVTDLAAALPLASEARVLVGLAPFLKDPLLKAAPHLEWVQALTTGVDNLLANPAMQGIALTNCGGIHGPQMSELAILAMLALGRRFPAMLDNQRNARWERHKQPLLQGKTLCIVGLGAIAQVLAGVAAPFGMRLIGVSDGRAEVPGFARVFRRADLAAALAEADFTVVLVPYSPETHHLIDAEALAAMKPSAYLINLARGGCVDEAALLSALREGRIAGAALDVFSTEPLPPGSPFWSAPNTIVTPHVGGYSTTYHEQALPVVVRNMERWLQGGTAALTNRLDKG